MLLHGVLKCYIFYFLFMLCATVKHHRVANIDKKVRNLRRIGDDKTDNNLESDQPEALNDSDDESDENNDSQENENQQSALEGDEIPKEESPQAKNSTEDKYIVDDYDDPAKQEVVPTFDVTDSSADKFLEISKLADMTGFDYSPAEVEKFKIWPQGIIPFYIDEFSYDKIFRDKIREYLDEANGMTGLRFLELPRPPTEENTRWVFIINRRGQLDCADYNHKSFSNTGVQKLVIGYDCLGGASHIALIVLALAGVPPQHNSPDRDKYIDVNMQSIQPVSDSKDCTSTNFGFVLIFYHPSATETTLYEAELADVIFAAGTVPCYTRTVISIDKPVHVQLSTVQWSDRKLINNHSIHNKVELFTAVKPEDWLFHDLKYDFLSAGHYPCHKYTADGSATIVPKSKISTLVGEVQGLSYTDVLKIRLLYNLVVEKDDKNAKLPDCKALYRPGPKFKMNEKPDKDSLLARKKPKEYIEAAQNAGIEVVKGSESTSNTPKDENIEKENNESKHNNDDASQDKDDEGQNDNHDENNDNNGNENALELAEESSKEMLKKPEPVTNDPMNWSDNVQSDE